MKKLLLSILLFLCACKSKPFSTDDFFASDSLEVSASVSCLSNNIAVTSLIGACGARPADLPVLTSGAPYIALSDPQQEVFDTYLFPGSNEVPLLHQIVGDSVAATIQPINGKIKIVAEGPSFARDIFTSFATKLSTSALDNPAVSFQNVATSGCDISCWLTKGMSGGDTQTQIVFLQHGDKDPRNGDCVAERIFPENAQLFRSRLDQRIGQLKIKYPNLKMIFVSSHIFGGWGCPPSGSRYGEPSVFEHGFAHKWLVEARLGQVAPFVTWGPYLWSAATPRSYYRSDGAHTCSVGSDAFAQQWFDFLLTNSSTRPWFAAVP